MMQNKGGIGRSLIFFGEQFGLWSTLVAPRSMRHVIHGYRRISLSSETPYRCSTSLGQDGRGFIHILQILIHLEKEVDPVEPVNSCEGPMESPQNLRLGRDYNIFHTYHACARATIGGGSLARALNLVSRKGDQGCFKYDDMCHHQPPQLHFHLHQVDLVHSASATRDLYFPCTLSLVM